VTLDGTSRESRKPKRFSSYATALTNLIDAKPSTYEETISQQVWKEAMNEKFQSIMKNDVWEIVLRSKGKRAMTS